MNIPLYTAFCVSAHLLIAIWAVSIFQLLWTLMYTFLFEHLFSNIWGLCLGGEMLDHMIILCLTYSWTSKLFSTLAAAAKSLQSCPTLCDPIDSSPPGSPVPESLQTRTLEWVAISFSNAWKWKVQVKLLSRVWLLATPWTAPHQAPLSMGFSRQEYWSGVPLPSPFPPLLSLTWHPSLCPGNLGDCVRI